MTPDSSPLVGSDGGIAKSGKTIYDSIHDRPDYFLAGGDLEAILRAGLVGLDLNYPLRTRSKVLKPKVCAILGYPVPTAFKKSKPRFPGQDFDTCIQKSNNLQIWNEEIVPTRRYVIIRLDESSMLEVKLQTAQTIDLGLVSPDYTTSLDFLPRVRYCDVRYAVFYGAVVGAEVRLDHLVLARGADFFTFFQRFEGKVVNAKLQIPLPRDFFG